MEKLIGIPFLPLGRSYAGADCAGLVIIFYRDILKIRHEEYLTYRDVTENNEPQIISALNNAKFAKVTSPKRKGDLLIIRSYGHIAHLGICFNERYFLHTLERIGSHLTEYEHPGWKRRIESTWRMI